MKTLGADGEALDAYLGPHIKSPHVYVIDQLDADTKKYDESKCFLGFGSKEHARKTYVAAFSDGKGAARIGKIHEMTVSEFKDWLASGDTKKPFKLMDKMTEEPKATKKQAGYRAGSLKERCGLCTMFVSPHGCTAVQGKISAAAVCDFFEAKSK